MYKKKLPWQNLKHQMLINKLLVGQKDEGHLRDAMLPRIL